MCKLEGKVLTKAQTQIQKENKKMLEYTNHWICFARERKKKEKKKKNAKTIFSFFWLLLDFIGNMESHVRYNK